MPRLRTVSLSRTGKLNIFVWGGVDYTDVFGNDRHFIFRTVNAIAALLSKPGDQAALKPPAIRPSERKQRLRK